MAVEVDIGKVRNIGEKSGSEGDKRRRKAFGVDPDSESWVLLCPPKTEAMGGLPWVYRMQHRRDVPAGVNASWNIICQRKNRQDNIAKCPPCAVWAKYIRKAKALWEELGQPKDERGYRKKNKWDKIADRFAAQPIQIAQVIDVSCLFSKEDTKMAKKLKKCFLKYGEVDQCNDCFLAETCEAGVIPWYMPVTIHDRISKIHFKDHGNICDFNRMMPIRVTRVGKGKNDTRYSTDVFEANKLKLTALADQIDSKMEDLSVIEMPPEGSYEELKKVYTDFFHMVGVDSDDVDDMIPDDLKEDLGIGGNGKSRDKRKTAAKADDDSGNFLDDDSGGDDGDIGDLLDDDDSSDNLGDDKDELPWDDD
jgi:hypothetical protein